LRNAKAPLTGQRILIAEDESLIAFELKTILESFGCKVVGPVPRVEEVLRYALDGECDGALLDVNLRDQLIFDILPELQALGLPFIIASGYQDATLFPAIFSTLPRVAKPVDESELRRVCEQVFGNPLLDRGTRRFRA
jgi:DNA-binding NarL/FixJ family response regulator